MSQQGTEGLITLQPLRQLLHRIKWDADFAKGTFALGYYDRVVRQERVIPLAAIRIDRSWPSTFAFEDEEGTVHRVPLHRVRTVYKDGEVIWQRASRPAD